MTQKYKVFINNKPKVIVDNWKEFCSKFTLIKAAGGLVFNHENELLMIFRNGKWDLPKGKLEKEESVEKCAIREVKEECGIDDLQIIKQLIDTYHTYELNDLKILKRTYWFKMRTAYNGQLAPQIQEGITKANWVKRNEIAEKLENSYGNIVQLLSE